MTHANVGSLLVFDPSKLHLVCTSKDRCTNTSKDAVVGIITERGEPAASGPPSRAGSAAAGPEPSPPPLHAAKQAQPPRPAEQPPAEFHVKVVAPADLPESLDTNPHFYPPPQTT